MQTLGAECTCEWVGLILPSCQAQPIDTVIINLFLAVPQCGLEVISSLLILATICLFKVCSCVSEALLRSLSTLSRSILISFCCSDYRVRLHFIACTFNIILGNTLWLSYASMGRHGRIHKLTFLHGLLCLTVDIPFSDVYCFPLSNDTELRKLPNACPQAARAKNHRVTLYWLRWLVRHVV